MYRREEPNRPVGTPSTSIGLNEFPFPFLLQRLGGFSILLISVPLSVMI
jgi:hypothetical protein